MERLLGELGIKHRYTRPYRPQTNGKAERFWRTLNEELLEGTTFETAEELREELGLYLLYSDTARLHQGLGRPPVGSRFRGNDEAPGWFIETGRSPVYGARAPNGFPPTRE